MNADEIIALCKRHTLYNWTAQDKVDPLPIERAEGVWVYTTDGRRLLDFNSQLMSVNIGHSHPKVIAAMKAQLDALVYAWPGAATAIRARMGRKLAHLLPGDIDTFFFTLGGAESNEHAVRIARSVTGRHKILSRYRSYHGATSLCLQLTGDPRRWASEPGPPGFVRVLDPQPYRYQFGQTPEQVVSENLRYLEEIITYEGPHTIAAMIIETVTGTNGILPPPPGYLAGLKALLDRHGILLICDEVMCGFGRTGELFAFAHGGIVPDIVTMAKGLTSSYAPLGAVGMRAPIAAHFKDSVFWSGLTYSAHPVSLAAAEANIDVLLAEGLVENAAAMGVVMRAEMDRLTAAHPCVREGRCIGLFGRIDLQRDTRGTPLSPYNTTHPVLKDFVAQLWAEGLFTYARWDGFYCNPPLCITEAQLREGFSIIDRALAIVDAVVTDP